MMKKHYKIFIACIFMLMFPWVFYGFVFLDWDILRYSPAGRCFVGGLGVVFCVIPLLIKKDAA